jgi:hypothetical protein
MEEPVDMTILYDERRNIWGEAAVSCVKNALSILEATRNFTEQTLCGARFETWKFLMCYINCNIAPLPEV